MAIDLSTLKAKKTPLPPRVLVYGGEGVGKSSFFAKAPNPVFLHIEDGLNELEVSKYPDSPCKNISEVHEILDALAGQKHEFQSVVLDSADWLESLIWDHLCASSGKKSISDFGYGEGYLLAAEEFRTILKKLDGLRLNNGMVVGITAHSQIKRYDDPRSGPYDRYMLKMHQRSSALIMEWCDIVGFASLKTFVERTDVGFDKTVVRGIGTGERVLCAHETPAFVAKNRYSLPSELPLSWAALQAAIVNDLSKTEKES